MVTGYRMLKLLVSTRDKGCSAGSVCVCVHVKVKNSMTSSLM